MGKWGYVLSALVMLFYVGTTAANSLSIPNINTNTVTADVPERPTLNRPPPVLQSKPLKYALWKMTGSTELTGVLISNNNHRIAGITDTGIPTACQLSKGQYFPDRTNDYGEDGNFMTYVHLIGRYVDRNTVVDGKTITPDMPYYFIEQLGAPKNVYLYKGQLVTYDTFRAPSSFTFKQPPIEEWFRANCENGHKIWIKADANLFGKAGICRASLTSGDYDIGHPPHIEGDCAVSTN